MAAARLCTVELNYACPVAGQAVRFDHRVRRRRHLIGRRRAVRRPQRREERRMRQSLQGRTGMVLSGGQRSLCAECAATASSLAPSSATISNLLSYRRVQLDLQARAEIRVHDGGNGTSVCHHRCGDGVEGRLRAVRRRQQDPLRRLLADVHHRAALRQRSVHPGVRRRAQVPARSVRRRQQLSGDGCNSTCTASRPGSTVRWSLRRRPQPSASPFSIATSLAAKYLENAAPTEASSPTAVTPTSRLDVLTTPQRGCCESTLGADGEPVSRARLGRATRSTSRARPRSTGGTTTTVRRGRWGLHP